MCPMLRTEIRSDWYRFYTPIRNSQANRFLESGLKYAVALLGKPKIPVRQIHLRLSTPLPGYSHLRSGFQLCEMNDENQGIFTIYLSRKTGEYAFWGQLAHEIAHLLNARLFDAYVEGLNTCFAEKLVKREGREWSGWNQYLRDGGDPVYGATYFMMRELEQSIGDQYMKNFLSHAVWNDTGRKRMHIDIDSWLDSLPGNLRKRAIEIILGHSSKVRAVIRGKEDDYAFMIPSRRK